MENLGPESSIVRVKESPRHRPSSAPVPTADYNLRIRYVGRSWLPVLLGAAVFGGLGIALSGLGLRHVLQPILPALLGAALGYAFEGRRTERLNQRT